MSTIVPVNTNVESSVPSPVVNVKPVIPANVNVPSFTVNVTSTGFAAASGSLMVIALPSAAEKTNAVSWSRGLITRHRVRRTHIDIDHRRVQRKLARIA